MNRFKTIFTSIACVVTAIVSMAYVQSATALPYSYADSFEGNPASVWRIESYPYIPSSTRGDYYTNYGLFSTFASYARTGSNYTYLTAGYDPTWWSGVGRRVNIPVGTGACQLKFYVNPWYKTRNKIRVEVIDPVKWTYISYHDVTIDYTTGGYKLVQTSLWSTNLSSVYVRIALSGGTFMPGYDYYTPTIGVDDMRISCPF